MPDKGQKDQKLGLDNTTVQNDVLYDRIDICDINHYAPIPTLVSYRRYHGLTLYNLF